MFLLPVHIILIPPLHHPYPSSISSSSLLNIIFLLPLHHRPHHYLPLPHHLMIIIIIFLFTRFTILAFSPIPSPESGGRRLRCRPLPSIHQLSALVEDTDIRRAERRLVVERIIVIAVRSYDRNLFGFRHIANCNQTFLPKWGKKVFKFSQISNGNSR